MALEYAQRCDSGYVLVCVVVGWAGLCAWGWRGWALNGAAGCLQGVALANCDVGISSSDKSDPYLKFLAMSKDAKPSEAKATKDSKPVKVYTVEVHKTEVVLGFRLHPLQHFHKENLPSHIATHHPLHPLHPLH